MQVNHGGRVYLACLKQLIVDIARLVAFLTGGFEALSLAVIDVRVRRQELWIT